MTTAKDLIQLGWEIWPEAAELTVLKPKQDRNASPNARVKLRVRDRTKVTIELMEGESIYTLLAMLRKRRASKVRAKR